MQLGALANVYLPYCLIKQEDGSYVILNRIWNPVCVIDKSRSISPNEYTDIKATLAIKGLGPATAKKLSWRNCNNTNEIYLHAGNRNPLAAAKDREPYLERLTILMSLTSR